MESDRRHFLTISEISSKYNVTSRTLRFYEQIGILSPLRQGLTRLYTVRDEVRLQVIQKGKKLGFSLKQIESIIGVSKSPAALTVGIDDDASSIDFMKSLSIKQIGDQIVVLEHKRSEINDAIVALKRVTGQG